MYASAYYSTPFRRGPLHGAITVNSPPELEKCRLLILNGGEDISPSLYGQAPTRTWAKHYPSVRDRCEVNLVKAAVKMGIPILGICRGAQLLCALGGGSLYQHVDNHGGQDHPVYYKGTEYWSNSCHHQMMIPGEDMEVLGSTPCRSPKKWTDDQDEPVEKTDDEPELVYMPKMKALAVQGHPEWLPYDHAYVQLIRNLTGELLHVEI
jgi:gamma-glutamyl-gamma-aminobutyrate hydrolase PuuD